jgi:hypothetical protein
MVDPSFVGGREALCGPLGQSTLPVNAHGLIGTPTDCEKASIRGAYSRGRLAECCDAIVIISAAGRFKPRERSAWRRPEPARNLLRRVTTYCGTDQSAANC